MRICYSVMLCLGAAMLVSCGTSGNVVNRKISSVKVAAIRSGLTKDQVRALLGDPQSLKTQVPVRQPPGVSPLPAKYTASEIWAFWSSNNTGSSLHLPFTARAPEKPPCTVIVYFDERGTVLDCQTSGELPN